MGILKHMLGLCVAMTLPALAQAQVQCGGSFSAFKAGLAREAVARGIPEETVEAAIVDGASPLQIFFKIKVPQIAGTIVVVWTTITLVVLKIFDIVFAMTNGQWETQVLANYMFDKLFRANDWGVGSASAIVIMLLVTPILVWNVHNARKEMR